MKKLFYKSNHYKKSRFIKYVNEFSRKLRASRKCKRQALDIIHHIRKHSVNFSGRNPKIIAAAILYISSCKCNKGFTQSSICDIAMIRAETLRLRQKEIQKIL